MAEAMLTRPPRKLPASLFVAILLGLVIAGQWFVWTGLLLMMLGAPAWSIVLVNLLLITIGIDAWRRALPRWTLLVPILAYGGNLAASGAGFVQYLGVKAEIDGRNAATPMAFDPAREALVTDYQTLKPLVSGYQLPAAFIDANARPYPLPGHYRRFTRRGAAEPLVMPPSPAPSYRSARLWLKADCDAVEVTDAIQVRTAPVDVDRVPLANACLLEMPETPAAPLVTSQRTQAKGGGGLLETAIWTLGVTGPGGAGATRVYGTAAILMPIPLPVIGCGLNDADSRWDCTAQLLRFPMPLGVSGKSGDDAGAAALASALNLQPRTIRIVRPSRGLFDRGAAEVDAAETVRISGDRAPVLALIDGLQAQRRADASARLDEVLAGRSPRVETGFGAVMAPHADQLAARADAMMGLLEDAVAHRDDGMVWEIGQVVAALPPAAFDRISGRLIALAPRAGWFARAPTLLTRLGDAAPASGPVLRQALNAPDRMATAGAVLGYCRAGGRLPDGPQAIAETTQRLRRSIDVGEAAYVAFLRLGRPDLAVVPPRRQTDWFDAIKRTVTPASPRSVCRIDGRRPWNLPTAAWLD
ncbi:hypothetical protein ACO2Q3_15830 [Caulobacter sp. KR2-114]|uniref:hypothetical protein n=1 Tax=Caulobacter sp. KR2-114 TaxID=3400912 RepID=UPI003C06E665